MAWSEAEISQRIPVWQALSEFWLDTTLEDGDFMRIAEVLANSPYSIKQLWDIALYEVAPAVWVNSLVAAGVWTGFDPAWLCESITQKSPSANSCFQPGWWKKLTGRHHARYLRAAGWDKVVQHYNKQSEYR